MTIRACESCGTEIEAYRKQKRCAPCQVKHARTLKALAGKRERQNNPDGVRARQKRYRDAHAEKIREAAQLRRPSLREYKDNWNDQARFGGLKLKAMIRDRGECRLCGATADDGFRNLTIHHIDGDKTHNVLENLITLCRECHPKVHNHWAGATRQDELRALVTV